LTAVMLARLAMAQYCILLIYCSCWGFNLVTSIDFCVHPLCRLTYFLFFCLIKIVMLNLMM